MLVKWTVKIKNSPFFIVRIGEKNLKAKTIYRCTECGYEALKWMGRCSECGAWNSFEEVIVSSNKRNVISSANEIKKTSAKALKLANIEVGKNQRILTGINEFDRVMGGGIVKDSVTIVTSPPGGGKSTLTLAIAAEIAKQGKKVLYATGEESDSQIKNRADRILEQINENIWIIADTSLNNVLAAITEIDADLIIVDSIQTFTLDEFLPARAGNPTQTMECANVLVQYAKNKERQRAIILIGQMNKNDEMAGLRSLEHLVDTVLLMEGNHEEELRSIIATKNRFGSTGEMGFFTMTEKGLISIDNPSEYFITKREKNEVVSGSTITVIREGSRPVISEIESLVSNSFTPYTSRICDAMKKDQMNTLISILEQKGKVSLYDKNVVIKTTGGIKLKEQAVNLAVIMCIASSVYNKAIPWDYAFIADVGLTGELKKVPSMESRVKELDRMGFVKVFIPQNSMRKIVLQNIEVIECKTLIQVITYCIGKK